MGIHVDLSVASLQLSYGRFCQLRHLLRSGRLKMCLKHSGSNGPRKIGMTFHINLPTLDFGTLNAIAVRDARTERLSYSREFIAELNQFFV